MRRRQASGAPARMAIGARATTAACLLSYHLFAGHGLIHIMWVILLMRIGKADGAGVPLSIAGENFVANKAVI